MLKSLNPGNSVAAFAGRLQLELIISTSTVLRPHIWLLLHFDPLVFFRVLFMKTSRSSCLIALPLLTILPRAFFPPF